MKHANVFSMYIPTFFPALFLCVRMNVQIISKSGMLACANLVRYAEEDEGMYVYVCFLF